MKIAPPGSFLLIHSTGLAARAIQVGTLSRVNHAALVAENGVDVIEANPTGVERRPLAKYDPAQILGVSHYRYPLSTREVDGILQFATTQIGKPYNWPGVTALPLAAVGVRPDWLDGWAQRADHWFCSQLIAGSWAAVERVLLPGRSWWTVSPGDLNDTLTRP